MCGITGIIKNKKIESADHALVLRMNAKLAHRGPSSEGTWSDAHAAIAMRRLSIIDLSTGNQPLWNEDSSVVLIANGEIYNFIELRKKLEDAGHHFKTKSDCETIIHAYEQYGGERFLAELRGMFAFCLYDMKKGVVLLARDRVGEKPLYLLERDGMIAFSSEMKSIIESLPPKERLVDLQSVYSYFHYGYIPEPKTMITAVRKLRAGHILTINIDPFEIKESEYWNYKTAGQKMIEQVGTPAPIIRDSLDELERIIIRSDVPVGVSLSGGLDSSLIALLSAKYSTKNLHAFSVGYPGFPENDERRFAKELASELKLTYHDIEITKENFLGDFNKMIYDMDDPIADIAAYGYYRVAKSAKEAGVPVLLAGFGGDELFWGYTWTRRAVRYNMLKQTIFGKCILFFLLAKENRYRLQNGFAKTLGEISHSAFSSDFIMYDLNSSFSRIERNKEEIFTKDMLAKIDPLGPKKLFTKTSFEDPETDVCVLLDEIWLSSNCIALGDRLSMAHSIEMRLPLVDYKLIETVFALRRSGEEGQLPDYKKGFKYWLIEAVKDIVPEKIISRKKRGFNPPTSDWMLSIIQNKSREIEGGYLVKHDILQKNYVQNCLKEASRHQEFLYRAALLETWIKAYQLS